MSPSPKQTKRYRDPLSPKPILDRVTLATALKSSGVVLKNGQLDLFYQLLHRSDYPPLDEFVAELRGQSSSPSAISPSTSTRQIDDVKLETIDESCSFSVSGSVSDSLPQKPLRSKNAISSRPGRRPKLPKSFIDFLSQHNSENDGFTTITSKVHTHQTSSDGSTTKIAVELQDGHIVESVLMRHERSRATLCVSSQVGCAMGCTFCATGTMGIRGNLSSGEILEQLVHASRILASSHKANGWSDGGDESDSVGAVENKENMASFDKDLPIDIPNEEKRYNDDKKSIRNFRSSKSHHRKKKQKEKRFDLIRNVVFMGMGEPLNNYTNVLTACRALIDRRLWNLAHNRVTVSTVGVPSRMRDLTRDLPEVNLALSLHAPNQPLREKIVPAAKGVPIRVLIEALDAHMMALTKRKVSEPLEGDVADKVQTGAKFNSEQRQSASKKKRAMIEYVMLEGETSTFEAAHQLGKLCEGRHLVVNLIPYNKTDVRDKLSCPSEEHMQKFRSIVSSYGSFCSIRRTMGADIAGACGQLVVEQENKQLAIADIEDNPFKETTEKKSDVASSPVGIAGRGKTKHVESGEAKDRDQSSTFMRADIGTNYLINGLTIATAISASCFLLSSALFIMQRRKK